MHPLRHITLSWPSQQRSRKKLSFSCCLTDKSKSALKCQSFQQSHEDQIRHVRKEYGIQSLCSSSENFNVPQSKFRLGSKRKLVSSHKTLTGLLKEEQWSSCEPSSEHESHHLLHSYFCTVVQDYGSVLQGLAPEDVPSLTIKVK